ncbi:hypothetical protein PoB_004733000 [Plakobranchus ocellatus]|uniref:Uncharacterized protein n=1 Tax=Plakobranchus ocellatus TaxID=259542 RepID=A0AAV4BN16_9GAST|nr:hypothetical protein PoB_004733000 [Plakobranchus ocellatus]
MAYCQSRIIWFNGKSQAIQYELAVLRIMRPSGGAHQTWASKRCDSHTCAPCGPVSAADGSLHLQRQSAKTVLRFLFLYLTVLS